MVSAAECKLLYLAEQVVPKGNPDRIMRSRLYRKIGVTKHATMDCRLRSLKSTPDCPRGAHYRIVETWPLGPRSMAVEWVAKRLLKEQGEEGFEHVKASTKDCLAVVRHAVWLVESGEFRNKWKRYEVSRSVNAIW